MKQLLFIVILIPSVLFSQKSEDNVWEPLQYFIGEWGGRSTGKSGEGNGERTYEFILNNNYFY